MSFSVRLIFLSTCSKLAEKEYFSLFLFLLSDPSSVLAFAPQSLQLPNPQKKSIEHYSKHHSSCLNCACEVTSTRQTYHKSNGLKKSSFTHLKLPDLHPFIINLNLWIIEMTSKTRQANLWANSPRIPPHNIKDTDPNHLKCLFRNWTKSKKNSSALIWKVEKKWKDSTTISRSWKVVWSKKDRWELKKVLLMRNRWNIQPDSC